MNYKEALAYLYEQLPMFHRVGAAAYKADLSNTKAMSRMLGAPELSFRTIHIAGTNGKGSTSHFLASVLQEAGYKTGLFTSPHLKDFRERIRINGRKISKRDVTHFVNHYRGLVETIHPSYFEWTFALATHYFSQNNVDVAVIETGMGGRLDSTNIIQPDLTIITNIGMDHTQFLGNTLEAIAEEKAGIIKPGIPLVIGETQAGPDNVFIRHSTEKNAPISFADKNIHLLQSGNSRHQSPLLWIDVRHESSPESRRYYSPLSGQYQVRNIRTVLEAVRVLKVAGYLIADRHIKSGIRKVIKNTGLMGRWQILSHHPMTIADVGHNIDGITAIVEHLETVNFRELHIVIGVVNDKDSSGMLGLLPKDARYYFCKANVPRGLPADDLKAIGLTLGLRGQACLSVELALKSARENAARNDLILVCGSIFVVAEIV